MIQKINPSFFTKLLFSYIDQKQKLKLVKCNKRLQESIDISIFNYRFISGKYIEYESDKIMKEYDGSSDCLIFEGEHLNAKRNGKGKEYDINSGKLIYEGDYLNGLRNGKGKEYDINRGNLIFEGEYFEGKKWNGYENEYYIDGGDFTQHLSYEGHVINGKRGPNLLDKNSNS